MVSYAPWMNEPIPDWLQHLDHNLQFHEKVWAYRLEQRNLAKATMRYYQQMRHPKYEQYKHLYAWRQGILDLHSYYYKLPKHRQPDILLELDPIAWIFRNKHLI